MVSLISKGHKSKSLKNQTFFIENDKANCRHYVHVLILFLSLLLLYDIIVCMHTLFFITLRSFVGTPIYCGIL